MSAINVLLLSFLVCASCDSELSRDASQSLSSEKRLDQMETVLQDLQSTVSSQKRLIHDFQSKASTQQQFNDDLQFKVSVQGQLIDQLKFKVSTQGELIDQLQSEKSQQDTLLAHQSSLLHELQNHVSTLEESLKQRDAKIKQQQATIQFLNIISTKTINQARFLQNTESVNSIALSDREHESSPYTFKTNIFKTSAGHDINARSDDVGKLQIVIDGLGQEVSKLDADVHTITSQIQSLQSSGLDAHTSINGLGQQVTKLGADFQAMSSQVQSLKSSDLDARTSTFVRWGSGDCPSHSQIVYSGVVGGKLNGQSGSGTNYLCLTMSPIMSSHAVPQWTALLYGSEYETSDAALNKDPVCAVCRASFSNVIMIPGTSACTSGWTPLYSGYLMAQFHAHPGATQFVCVDSTFQSRPGSDDNREGALMYFTASACGSLPCGPYVNNKIVTCVVCGR